MARKIFRIIITEDQECVYSFDDKDIPSKIIREGWTLMSGYKSLEEAFNDVVTKQMDQYEYESTVEET